MKAIACIGNYAENPYYFERFDISVYSMEELSFCLKENAFMLGTEIMDDEMLHFISAECNLPELAKELYPMVHRSGSLSAFVTCILECVGFYDNETIMHIANTVKMGSGLSDYEKQKMRIDFLIQRSKYLPALEAYDELIALVEGQNVNGKTARRLLADMWYNKGIIYAELFLYGNAAEAFRIAYEIRKTPTLQKAWLFAKRMELPEKDYIALIGDHPECYEVSKQLEKQLQMAENEWSNSLQHAGLENMHQWRSQGDIHRYEEEADRLVGALKEQYRS